ncbi:ferredoxin reductase [Corynebacterium epidermidicanis]|uniref:ferredoxin reductase n=1 Tax=Corynebacterium epidermidicanis TaxID=1050174 RepID=UPI001F30D84C|nr:ferredoxin reductase [Corynebacterium epidermidicanis]
MRRILKNWTTPLLPDDYSALINPLWSTRELRGVIRQITPAAEGSILIDIEPGWGVPVHFEAGQYIGIGVSVEGRYVWRSYSIVTAPTRRAKNFQICVRAVADGQLSNHLQDNARPGEAIRLAAPAGDFYLTDPIPHKLLFVTAGSGLTPVISMLRMLDDRRQLSDAVLIHSVRAKEELIFAEELDRLQEANPGLRVDIRVTSVDGRITIPQLEEMVPDFADRAPYACGPAQLLNELSAWWATGVDKPYALRTEHFTLDRASDARGGTVTFGNRGSVIADGATTILEAAESAGIRLPSGCRMGICQTCVQSLKEGHAHNLRTGETHEPGSRVRVCCTVANGDVTLDI